MRVSVNEQDPGYAPHLIGRARVFFAGTERSHVFTADEERRLVVVAKLNDKGQMRLDADDKVITETLYGDVRVEVTA